MNVAADTLDATAKIDDVFAGTRAEAFVHARDLQTGVTFGVRATEPVVTASTFKVAVALELARQIGDGTIAATDRLRVTDQERTPGLATGICSMRDDVEISLRDLAALMMSVSDNAATDVLMRVVGGSEAINRTLWSLGLRETRVAGDVADMVNSFLEDLGFDSFGAMQEAAVTGGRKPTPATLAGLRMRDPNETSRTTAEEMTRLLELIWTDQAGPAHACSEVRHLMSLQGVGEAGGRIATGFPPDVQVSAKSGTTFGIRNEVGVVTFPGGDAVAVAVYTRPAEVEHIRLPVLDLAIGRAAALAVTCVRERHVADP